MLGMNTRRRLSRLSLAFLAGTALLQLTGCNGAFLRPRNYMCQGECHAHRQEFARQQATLAPIETVVPAPTIESLSKVHERIEQIAADHELLREGLSSLDKRNEEQRNDQQELIAVMQTVADGIASVHEQLGRQQNELAVAHTRLTNDRQRNDQVLDEVERQLNELLSKHESALPGQSNAPQ